MSLMQREDLFSKERVRYSRLFTIDRFAGFLKWQNKAFNIPRLWLELIKPVAFIMMCQKDEVEVAPLEKIVFDKTFPVNDDQNEKESP